MFYNHSNFGNVSGVFTKEIFQTLMEFKDLRIMSGNQPADAVLIGIIESKDKKKESVKTAASNRVQSTYGESIIGSNREDFVIPSVKTVGLSIRIIVIKHPTKEEISFLQKDIARTAINSKIIFNEIIGLSESYSMKGLKGEATKVLGTQNRGVERQTMGSLAKKAASSFKDMILYAF
jgi:hypothetical protein